MVAHVSALSSLGNEAWGSGIQHPPGLSMRFEAKLGLNQVTEQIHRINSNKIIKAK